MEYLPIITRLIGSSLLALSLLGVTSLLYSASQRLFGKQIISYAISILALLVLVSISLVILNMSLNNSYIDPKSFFTPERVIIELIISVLMVVSFLGTRLTMNWSQSVKVTKLTSLNQMLVQWDAGKVSDTLVKRGQILYSLLKWIEKKNESGWYELGEQVTGKLTDSTATWIVLKELNSIQQKKEDGNTSVRNHNYEKRLESLITIESVGEVWQKWDNGLVSEDVAHEAQEVNAFKKWVLNGDETGWVDLQFIRQSRDGFSSTVVEFAEYELQEISEKKRKHEAVDVEIEKKLKKLVFI